MKNSPRQLVALLALVLTWALTSCGEPGTSTVSALPEDSFTYAVSHILIRDDKQNPAVAPTRIVQVQEELAKGTPFEEVARRMSENERTAPRGGWIGFLRPREKDAFAGAVQALPPGQISGAVQTEQDTHFIRRHTFEEGREIERRTVIPAYGFFVPWATDGTGPSRAQAETRAQEALESIRKGELSLEEAARRYSTVESPRADFFIANVQSEGPHADIHRVLGQVEPGEVAAVAEIKGAYVIAGRGRYFRSQVRHILIQHLESKNRPLAVSRTKTEARALAEEVRKQVAQDTSTWGEAVRRHSDDTLSAALNGWMGAVTNGELNPAIEAAVLLTDPGHVASEVVENEDGFHILYRVK